MVSTILGDAAVKKIQTIPLSDNTINRRIQEMSGDIKEQVVAAIKESGKFSLQLDESTDVSDDAQLLVYVRYLGRRVTLKRTSCSVNDWRRQQQVKICSSWLITSSKKRDLNGISATVCAQMEHLQC